MVASSTEALHVGEMSKNSRLERNSLGEIAFMGDSLADPSFPLTLKYKEISVICNGGSHLSNEIINSWLDE